MALTTALPNLFPTRWRLFVGNLVIIASLVGLAAFSAYESRHHYRQVAQISLGNLSETLARNLSTVIEKTDLSLRTIALEIDRQMTRESVIDPSVLRKILTEQKSLQPDVYSLRVTDPAGIIRYGTGVPSESRVSVADRDYFVRLRDDPQAGLFISEPYVGRIASQWIVVLARRLDRPDGSFGGVVYAVITTDHFKEMLSSLDLGPNGSVTLQTEERHLIARIPDPKDRRAMDTGILSEPSEETLNLRPIHGTFTSVSPLDQIERSYVYRKVANFPLYIVVGRAIHDNFALWWEEVIRLAAIVTAFSFLALGLLRSAQRAAERQQAARRLLQEAVDSIDAGFSIFDGEDRLVICNEAYRKLHPASRHLLVPGVRFQDIVRNKAATGHYQEATSNPEEWVSERLRRHQLADGTSFEQQADNGRHLLTIEHRTPSGYIVGNQMDITELVQYRDHLEKIVDDRTAQLQAALGQFRIFVEQAPTAIAMFDRDMTYLAASVRWMEEYGQNLDHLIGRNHYEAHPDLPESWKEAHRAALSGIPQEMDEQLWVRADGRPHWINWAVYPWRKEDGAIGGIIIAADDITDRILAEESVRIAQARFNRLFEANMVGIVIADARGHITEANDYYLGILDCTREDLLSGRVDWREMTPPEWLPADEKALRELQATGVCSPYEKEYVRRDGSRRTVLLADAILPGEEGLILAVVQDITERKQAEEEIQRLNTGLERQIQKRTAELAQSNEALLRSNMELQHFAHAAAHDLQTPLRSIASFTQLLQRATQNHGDEQLQEWSSLVIDNTRRLQVLIQELLFYTRLDTQGLPFEEIDLQSLFDEVIASLATLIVETGTDVRCSPLPTLPVDRIQIALVFQNLIENGIKYNKSKPPRITVKSESRRDEWVFSVADNGIGIDPKHHGRIFEIFRRLHTYSQVPGTGIGLALCRRIVQRHGGRIWVDSRPGEGSTFYFTLPARRVSDKPRTG